MDGERKVELAIVFWELLTAKASTLSFEAPLVFDRLVWVGKRKCEVQATVVLLGGDVFARKRVSQAIIKCKVLEEYSFSIRHMGTQVAMLKKHSDSSI